MTAFLIKIMKLKAMTGLYKYTIESERYSQFIKKENVLFVTKIFMDNLPNEVLDFIYL